MITFPLVHQMLIRCATRADLPALEWEGELIHFRRLFAEAFRQSELGNAIIWLAELTGVGVIGQVFVQMESIDSGVADGKLRAYIYGFRVRSTYRGAGIGSHLLQTAEADLNQRGFQRVCLNVGRDNLDARRLYERMGYRVVAPEPGIWSYIDDRGRRRQVNEPAWRMEKEL